MPHWQALASLLASPAWQPEFDPRCCSIIPSRERCRELTTERQRPRAPITHTFYRAILVQADVESLSDLPQPTLECGSGTSVASAATGVRKMFPNSPALTLHYRRAAEAPMVISSQ